MFEKFKEFIGIDDNYDDYDDDQMYYDDDDIEEDDARKRTTYSDLFDDEEKESTYTNDSYKSTKSNKSTYSDDYSLKNSFSSESVGDNVVSINNSSFSRSTNMRISIQEPLDYDNDGPVVIDEILKNRVVVLNLEMVDNDLRMRLFDFVSGAVFALKGNMRKVTKGIFVITPNGVEIDSYVADQISDGNYNQL